MYDSEQMPGLATRLKKNILLKKRPFFDVISGFCILFPKVLGHTRYLLR